MKRSLSELSIVTVVFLSLLGVGVMMSGEPASKHGKGKSTPEKHHIGLVEDWSTHHLVFSNPGTYEQAVAKGTYSKWLDLRYNSRFIMQQARRKADAVSASGSSTATFPPSMLIGEPTSFRGVDVQPARPTRKPRVNEDWSVGMLTGALLPNTFPAKWSFNTTGTPSCSSDFVVYPTGSTGSATAATIVAFNNLYATTCSGTVPSVYWAYNTGAGAVTTSPTISGDGTQVAFVQVASSVASLVLLKWQSNTTGRTVTGTVTSGSTSFTVSSSTPLTANDVGAQISGTGIPSGDTIASVTSSTAGTLATAATGSYSSETLTITAEAVGTPGVPPTAASASAYRSCTAPCMYAITLNGSPNDTYSSPFYDYAVDDALYVGDNSGKLHKFTGVFSGTPTESGGNWPATLNASYDASSPVYDPTSGCVFVGNTYGYFYSVNSGSGGTICTGASGTIYGTSENLGDSAAGDGVFDAPLLDSTAGMVYVFVAASAAIGNCSTAGSNCVYQFQTGFSGTSAVPHNEEPLGTGGANYDLYAGTFDNVYYSSTGSSPSGNLYVVGNTHVTGGGRLYRVPITSNAMGTPASAVTGLNSTHYPWPSPVTEFCNNGASACAVTTGGTCGTGVTCTTSGTDYLFFSVYRGAKTGCTNANANGCILDYTVNNPSSTPTLAGSMNITAPGTTGCWGTGGFIIDNSSTATGASQVYFVNLDGNSPSATPTTCTSGTGNTIDAVQAAQSNLAH